MDHNEVLNRVKKVIASVLKVDAEEIKPDSNFVFDLGADSQQSIELVCAFEEEFEIDMQEDMALKIQNVSGAVNYISECL